MKKVNIWVDGFEGTWKVVDTKDVNDRELWMLEHEEHGRNTWNVITAYGGEKVIVDRATSWEDLPNKYEIELKVEGRLPSRAPYPLLYIMRDGSVVCADCAGNDTEDIDIHDIYWEGPSIECDGGCGEFIESAYGDPEDEDEE